MKVNTKLRNFVQIHAFDAQVQHRKHNERHKIWKYTVHNTKKSAEAG
jgi:hypothetical protein